LGEPSGSPKLFLAAGNSTVRAHGTVGEVAQALAGTDTVLAVMPLGRVMNVARTLCISRDLQAAAQVIRDGRGLTIDLGKVGATYFIEAAGVGLDAGLFAYFEELDSRGMRLGTIRAALRFLRNLGTPRLLIEVDGHSREVRAPMVSVANAPFVGAAYAIAPEARIDDGLLDVVIF
jgi:diacylglycerol kinase (ATP)